MQGRFLQLLNDIEPDLFVLVPSDAAPLSQYVEYESSSLFVGINRSGHAGGYGARCL